MHTLKTTFSSGGSGLLLLLCATCAIAAPQPGIPKTGKRPLVVIDPGHGGGDRGATARLGAGFIAEKDLALLLSYDVAAALRSRDVNVALTRKEDEEVALSDRTALANRLRADAFVSIHLNAIGTGDVHGSSANHQVGHQFGAQGFETYVLNHSTDRTSQRLADLENSVLKGSVAAASAQSEVSLIVKDLILEANRKRSHQLACAVQSRLAAAPSPPSSFNLKSLRNRGVKEGLFYVLLGADMPSILIEAGFVQSSWDRSLILNPGRRRDLARGIAEGVMEFLEPRKQLANCKIRGQETASTPTPRRPANRW